MIVVGGGNLVHAQNLIGNPDFDVDISEWTALGGATASVWNPLDADDAPFSGSVLLTDMEASVSTQVLSQCLNVDEGILFKLGASVYVPGGQAQTGTARVRVLWFQEGNCADFIDSDGGPFLEQPEDLWIATEGTVRSPIGAQSVRVALTLNKDSGTTEPLSAHFDEILFAPVSDGPVVPFVDEFQVNTYTTSTQARPDVAVSSDGRALVVWESIGSTETDVDAESIQGQIISPNGTHIGGQFQINNFTTGQQHNAAVTALADDGFLVVWQSGSHDVDGPDESLSAIQGRRFDSAGSPVGQEFQINTTTLFFQTNPDVAASSSGGFIVVWDSSVSASTDDSDSSILAQRFSPEGMPVGNEFQVNTYTTGFQIFPSVAVDTGGNFFIAFESGRFGTGPDGSGPAIRARLYNSVGTPITNEFQVNSFTSSYQGTPSVAVGDEGHFAVVWQSDGFDGDIDDAIVAQLFDLDAKPQGEEFRVNDRTQNVQRIPSIAKNEKGDFVVVWNSWFSSNGTDDSFYSIQGRSFDPSGLSVGPGFQVNTYTTDEQRLASAAFLPGGDFLVVWDSEGSGQSDSSSWSIQGRRYAMGIFRDGFESGDTTSWSAAVP